MQRLQQSWWSHTSDQEAVLEVKLGHLLVQGRLMVLEAVCFIHHHVVPLDLVQDGSILQDQLVRCDDHLQSYGHQLALSMPSQELCLDGRSLPQQEAAQQKAAQQVVAQRVVAQQAVAQLLVGR